MPRNSRTSELSTPLTLPCCVTTTGSATAIGAPQAHANTNPSRVDRTTRYGSSLAGLIMGKSPSMVTMGCQLHSPRYLTSLNSSAEQRDDFATLQLTELHRPALFAPPAGPISIIVSWGKRVVLFLAAIHLLWRATLARFDTQAS